ncbi:MAG TPA: hypothetical protein VK502_03405 [Candidatus Saccharimonadales bacterium]|nr:hypothetical protein [Candidatus Saccharimonadales bacterium]
MSGGTQYSEATSAAKAYQQAIQAHVAAKKAPHTGSATSDRLKAAATARTKAEQAFTTKYTLYFNSMTESEQRAQPRSYFVNENP